MNAHEPPRIETLLERTHGGSQQILTGTRVQARVVAHCLDLHDVVEIDEPNAMTDAHSQPAGNGRRCRDLFVLTEPFGDLQELTSKVGHSPPVEPSDAALQRLSKASIAVWLEEII